MKMRLHNLVFSEKGDYRMIRHFAFWAIWWLYFFLSYLLLQQPIPGSNHKYLTPGGNLLIKTLLFILLFVPTCYYVIYYTFPKIIKGEWLVATIQFILISALVYGISYLLYWDVFSVVDSVLGFSKPDFEGTRFWPPVSLGLLNFVKVVAAAVSIKYVKYWWQKTKEAQRLEKEKVNADLQLLKAQVQPEFLFKTLNSIYNHAVEHSPRTPGMLLKLSDLLSYMLYECDQPVVPLSREVEMLREYAQLERIRHNDKPEIHISVRGDVHSHFIAPFLLLPFIENSFKQYAQGVEHFWINMDIRIDKSNLIMKLTNGVSVQLKDQALESEGLANVQKRLTLLYPGCHELKKTVEQEMLIVVLNIELGGFVPWEIEEKGAGAVAEDEWFTKLPELVYASR